jgi:hypothetical protein
MQRRTSANEHAESDAHSQGRKLDLPVELATADGRFPLRQLVALMQISLLLLACGSTDSDCLEFLDNQALRFPTHHVQGLAVTQDTFYVSSVDKEAQQGWLFQVDRDSLSLQARKELTAGTLIHPGGMDMDGIYLWIPNAEYDKDGPTEILQLDPQTLELVGSFFVDDHIGLIASNGTDRLYGANWDSLSFYVWDWDGNLIEKVDGSTRVKYQDCEFLDPLLVCGGQRSRKRGAIDFIDPESWTLVDRIAVGETGVEHSLAHEGLSVFGETVYLLPEDGPNSEVLLYRLCRMP